MGVHVLQLLISPSFLNIKSKTMNTKKIEFLEGFLEWISEDKFCWTSSCSCWDGLIWNYFNGSEDEMFGLLIYKSYVDHFESETNKLSHLFSLYELQCFEFLVKFWEGEKHYGFKTHPTSYNSIRNYDDYQTGISYFQDYITYLKEQDPTNELQSELNKIEINIPSFEICVN